MSAAKQAFAVGGILTALFASQYAIASRMSRTADDGQPVFHVGFPHVYTAPDTNNIKKEKSDGQTSKGS